MANYETLKSAIQQVVKTNGNEEITGALLQQTLFAMVNSLGAGYQYAGVATPATNPGTPDQNIFYIASESGTYSNFGGLSVSDGEVAILKYSGTWTKEVTGAATAAQVTQLGQEVTGNIVKDITWSYGYIQAATGLIKTSSLSKFSQPILLKAGEKVTIGTQNSNIGIICSTNADSVAIGDTVTVIKATSASGQFETYEYTAEADIKIVVCVLWSNYNISFLDTNSLTYKIGNAATKQELDYLGQEIDYLGEDVDVLKNGEKQTLTFLRGSAAISCDFKQGHIYKCTFARYTPYASESPLSMKVTLKGDDVPNSYIPTENGVNLNYGDTYYYVSPNNYNSASSYSNGTSEWDIYDITEQCENVFRMMRDSEYVENGSALYDSLGNITQQNILWSNGCSGVLTRSNFNNTVFEYETVQVTCVNAIGTLSYRVTYSYNYDNYGNIVSDSITITKI